MAYALRYYKEFTHADGKVVRLEIHKKDSTTAAVEIGAVVQGMSLQIQGQQGDIDTPIVKTSLSMTFVDAGDIENGQKNGFWEEFYTPDSVLWKVLVKAKKAGETAFTTIWGGYVTPDSFSESLTYRGSVNIIARDNIGHMQDFPFDAEGDEDGMISLYDLVNTAWAKIESPMSLMWDGGHWMQCEGVNGYNTLMNVSAFEGMSWYDAVEKALYSYGGVMRYIGGNEVLVTTLRYMPTFGRNIDRLPRIEPTFVTGATRELVPAVKRVEESVKYDISQEIAEQVGPSDYTGDVETYTLVGNSVDKDGIAYPINNRTSGQGWCNPDGSLFFNPQYYTFAYDKDADAKYMWLAANNYQLSSSISTRYAEYSKRVLADNLIFNISFGSPYAFRADGSLIQFNNITACTFVIMAEQGGVTEYLNGEFEWVTEPTKFEIDASAGFSIPINLESYDGMVLLRVQIHQVLTTTDRYAGQRFVPVYSAGLSCNKSLLETNTVNTNYQEGNNVVLSRDPEIGPAYNTVALPAFIKNGIFRRDGNQILPAYKWGWSGSTPQQMAVYNHLQLLAYYAKPNNLISGTIVNADVTDIACIYEWHHADHILVSGNLNLLNGHIEGAMLREYARYEYLWADVEGAGFPETEEASTTNVEGGASAGGSSSTYTNNTTVNIGSGGSGGTGASQLNDLSDVDTTGVVAQSVLYFNGTEWVDQTKAAFLKDTTDRIATLEGFWSLDDDGNLVTDRNVIIKNNLIVTKDTSTGGTGTDQGVSGTVTGIRVDADTILEPTNGIVDMSDVLANLEVDVDLSDYYTKQETLAEIAEAIAGIDIPSLEGYAKLTDIPSLDGYATEAYVTDAITALNLGQYATTASLATLQTEVDDIEAILGMDEEAEGIINTWNEVKAFLGSIEVDDDLASILERMNADIATRALDSDLDTLAGRVGVNELAIADNAGNIKKNFDAIGVLESNKADKATTLAGYGITDAYTKTEVVAELAKYILKEAESQTIKGNITIEGNLVVTGDTASGGTGSDAGVAGTLLGIKVNGVTYNEPVNGILTIPDYPTSLTWSAIEGKPTNLTEFTNDAGFITSAALVGYATQSWVEGKGYITGIDKAMVASAVGSSGNAGKVLSSTGGDLGWVSLPTSLPASDVYSWAKKSSLALVDVPDLSSKYLPLSTLSNRLKLTNGAALGFVDTSNVERLLMPMSWKNNALGWWDGSVWEDVIHSGNYSSYALPLSGGRISGNLDINTTTDTTIRYFRMWYYASNRQNRGMFRVNENNVSVSYYSPTDGINHSLDIGRDGLKYISNANTYTLIHSGNIGSQQVSSVFTGTISDGNTAQYTDRALRWFSGIPRDTANLPAFSGYQNGLLALSLHAGGATAQLYFHANDGLFYRGNTAYAWKTIAFTDSNVASAQALKHSNGTIGAVVNSSGNVTIGPSDLAAGSSKLYVSGVVRIGIDASISTTNGTGALLIGVDRHIALGSNDIQAKDNKGNPSLLYINDWGGNVILCGQNKGNVLIGTTTDSGYKLDVNGVTKASALRTTYIGIDCDADGNTSGYDSEINRFGANLYLQNREGNLYLSHSAGTTYILGLASITGAVTMSSTLSVTTSVTTPLLKSAGGLDIVANGSAAGSRLFLTTNCFRPWVDDSKLIDLGASNAQWRNVYAVNAVFSGDTATGSDIRFKDRIADHRIALSDIAQAPLFTFKWNDREDKTEHLGTSAQYWEGVAPWLVKGTDFKSLDYSTLGVAIGISLANKTLNHEERIRILENKIEALEAENRRLRYGS